jgi:glycosyltransferase involved in cell wall biosynthesis
MAQDPLHVLWVEPQFPGRLGAVADWLVRKRGYRCRFYCHALDARERWPSSVGRGLDVGVFKVGGVARERSVAWQRVLERGLCYAFGSWEVIDRDRPRPVDLIVGRSEGLGSTLFSPVYRPGAPVVNFHDYYFHSHQYDLADEAGPEMPAGYFQWRRSANAVDLLDLENGSAAWTATNWQRGLFPAEYRGDFHVHHDGVDTRRHAPGDRSGTRKILGRSVPAETRVVTFVARSLDRLRGFDRFLSLAAGLLRDRSDVICIGLGDPVVRRGLDVEFHQRDYKAHLLAALAPLDPERLWFPGHLLPDSVAEVLSASDLHIAPSRRYPVARSLLEAMSAGAVVLASDTEPHREFLTPGVNGLLASPADPDDWMKQARSVLDDPAGFRPIGDAASTFIREHCAQDATLPRLAALFSRLVDNRDDSPGS